MEYDPNLSNFGIYNRKVIDALLSMRESNRGFTAFIKWMGFKQKFVDVTRSDRHEGKSSYSFKKRFKMATDILFAQTDYPVQLISKFGIFALILSILGAIVSTTLCCIFKKYILLTILTIVCCSVLVIGVLLLAIGLVGNYITRIYNETKNRPLYFIREVINDKKNS